MLTTRKQWIMAGSAFAVVLIYIIGWLVFTHRLYPMTQFGPVNVGGSDVAGAQAKIASEIGKWDVSFKEDGQTLGTRKVEQLRPEGDYHALVASRLAAQRAFIWPVDIWLQPRQVDIQSELQIDAHQVATWMEELPIQSDSRQSAQDAFIQKQDDGSFVIHEEVYGNELSAESMTQAIRQAIGQGQETLDASAAFVQPSVKSDDEALTQAYQTVEKMMQTELTLDLYPEPVTISKQEMSDWIVLNGTNPPTLDIEAIENYIYLLNEQYAGLFHPWLLQSTYQGPVWVQSGTYGWYIDRFTEAEQIAADMMTGETITREPYIVGDGYGTDNQFTLGNYVEVDIAYQMMFIYRDHQLVLETPIVSGIVGAETIPGAYQVWNKEQDTTLVGYNVITEKDYEVPVSYWIAFDNQAQGIHDASWQSYFGGDAYIYSGSQGCINTPSSIMPQVYELVDYGMPVLIH